MRSWWGEDGRSMSKAPAAHTGNADGNAETACWLPHAAGGLGSCCLRSIVAQTWPAGPVPFCTPTAAAATSPTCHRRFEMVMPADDGYQEVASLLAWHEEEAASKWRGAAPREFLEAHCKAHKASVLVVSASAAVALARGRVWCPGSSLKPTARRTRCGRLLARLMIGAAHRAWRGCRLQAVWRNHQEAGVPPNPLQLPSSDALPLPHVPPCRSCRPPASTCLSATARRHAPTSVQPACCRTWACSSRPTRSTPRQVGHAMPC